MTLTSARIAPFYISTFEWNAALDLASRKQDGSALYGWDRAAARAIAGGSASAALAVDTRDGFGFAWGQSMKPEDVQALAIALRRATEAAGEGAPDFLPQLIEFLEKCALRHQKIKMEQ